MDPRTAAEHMATIDQTPALNRGAPVREVLFGLITGVAVFLMLYVPTASETGAAVGAVSAAGAVVLVLAWIWYHSERPLRRPQSRVEKAFRTLSVCLMGGGIANLIWGGPDSTIGIIVPAVVPAVCLLVFLALRWRA